MVVAQREEAKEKKRIELKELKKQAKQNKQKLLNNLSLEVIFDSIKSEDFVLHVFDKDNEINDLLYILFHN